MQIVFIRLGFQSQIVLSPPNHSIDLSNHISLLSDFKDRTDLNSGIPILDTSPRVHNLSTPALPECNDAEDINSVTDSMGGVRTGCMIPDDMTYVLKEIKITEH